MAGRDRTQIGWPFRKLGRHPLLGAIIESLGLENQRLHAGWGLRPSGRAAIRAAAADGGDLLLLEDSLVRSLRPGSGGPVYGLLADSRGIHYNAAGKSDLLTALETGKPCGWMRKTPAGKPQTPRQLMTRFREIGASKYNWFPGEFRDTPLPDQPGILVVDQSRGDMAIRCGGLTEADFERMLRDALDQSAGEPVYLRAHPDHLFRSRRTCFPSALLKDSRIHLLPPDLSPAQCFSFCHTVMVGSSLMGMEALIHDRKVITYGWPFFAGWGLTEDRGAPGWVEPGRAFSLVELFDAAYLRYCHYFDPDTREPCGLGEILDHLELQKDMFRRNRGLSVTIGLTPWNRRIVPFYLRSPAGTIRHLSSMAELENTPETQDARFYVWGRRPEIPPAIADRCSRIEDGFVRSKGLGAAFNFPYSWVIDHCGVYFDASAASDLEKLLNDGFDAKELGEAAQLIGVLRDNRLTKYNLDGPPVTLDPAAVAGRKVILVPGQVETDASIAFGSPDLKSNLALLRAVRELEPDAYLVYKAHPDLVAGTRHGRVLPDGFAEACDLAVTAGNVLDWLELCDEVHTLTSTVGFEALVRKVPVFTYGLPFYAGWGLTRDRASCPRRKRLLTLEELVCGALIRYPRYVNPATGEFTTALKVARILGAGAADQRAWHLKAVSKLKKIWVEMAR